MEILREGGQKVEYHQQQHSHRGEELSGIFRKGLENLYMCIIKGKFSSFFFSFSTPIVQPPSKIENISFPFTFHRSILNNAPRIF
jgi:hypothetical protein